MIYILAASYDRVEDAVADYEAIDGAYRHFASSHDFDATVVAKDETGKVDIVRRHDEPTRRSAGEGFGWGMAAGAVAALFPAIGILGALAAGGRRGCVGRAGRARGPRVEPRRFEAARRGARRRRCGPGRGLRPGHGRPRGDERDAGEQQGECKHQRLRRAARGGGPGRASRGLRHAPARVSFAPSGSAACETRHERSLKRRLDAAVEPLACRVRH